MADGNAPLNPHDRAQVQEFDGIMECLENAGPKLGEHTKDKYGLELSVKYDIKVLKKVYELASSCNPVRIALGERQEAFYQILNSILLEQSPGNTSLQGILLKLVDAITLEPNETRMAIQNYAYIIPSLVVCLSSKEIENRKHAAFLVRVFAELDSGFSREIGRSGAVTALIHNIGGDQMCAEFAIEAMLQLCLELENRELAVSNGVTTAVMEMVVKRVLVEKMLQTLDVLSQHERAIVEMEEHQIMKCLFEILGEEFGERAHGYCVAIIHTMYARSASRGQIKDVENARQTLERLVLTTETTRVKVNELLSKLRKREEEDRFIDTFQY